MRTPATWDEVKAALDNGASVMFDIWFFTGCTMSCYSGCCNDGFRNTDEALETLKVYANNNLAKVSIL